MKRKRIWLIAIAGALVLILGAWLWASESTIRCDSDLSKEALLYTYGEKLAIKWQRQGRLSLNQVKEAKVVSAEMMELSEDESKMTGSIVMAVKLYSNNSDLMAGATYKGAGEYEGYYIYPLQYGFEKTALGWKKVDAGTQLALADIA